MEDLVDAVGVDAARYALARSSADSQIDIDLDLLTRRSNDNPVYYVQYAHARTAGVTRLAEGDGVRTEDGFDPSLLTHETESLLLAALGEFPRVLGQAADAAGAAPGRAVPRAAGRAPTTAGTTRAGSARTTPTTR